MAEKSNGSSGHASTAAAAPSIQPTMRYLQVRCEHGAFLAAAQFLDAAAYRLLRAFGQHHAALEHVVEGVERRLAVAGVGQRAGVVARLDAPAFGIGNERRQEPHQRPPFLHGAAEFVHGVLARAFRIGHHRARAGENVPGDAAHRGTDRCAGLQGRFLEGGFLAHFRVNRTVHGNCGAKATIGWENSDTMAKYPPARTSLIGDRLLHASPILLPFDAGWSSPVARQAHNLKVIGSNPIPATKLRRQVKDLAAF